MGLERAFSNNMHFLGGFWYMVCVLGVLINVSVVEQRTTSFQMSDIVYVEKFS